MGNTILILTVLIGLAHVGRSGAQSVGKSSAKKYSYLQKPSSAQVKSFNSDDIFRYDGKTDLIR